MAGVSGLGSASGIPVAVGSVVMVSDDKPKRTHFTLRHAPPDFPADPAGPWLARIARFVPDVAADDLRGVLGALLRADDATLGAALDEFGEELVAQLQADRLLSYALTAAAQGKRNHVPHRLTTWAMSAPISRKLRRRLLGE